MSLLAALRADLIERRLWPVALVLVVALVAVPVLLLRSPSAPTTAPGAASSTGGTASGVPLSVVNVAQTPGSGPGSVGRSRNPFAGAVAASGVAVGQALGAARTATTGASKHAGTGAAAGSGSTSGSAGATAGAGGTTGTTGTTGAPTSTVTAPPNPSRVVLRLGPEGSLSTLSVPVPLGAAGRQGSVIPSRTEPYAVVIGVTKGQHRVVLLLSGQQVLNSDADCLPDQSQCREVILAPGQRVVFPVTDPQGHEVRYVIGVNAVHLDGGEVTSAATTASSAAPAPDSLADLL